MNIIYTSENKIYSFENSNKTEIPCGRVIKYKETLDSIRRRSEWKTTGSGAMFTGTAMKAETIEMIVFLKINETSGIRTPDNLIKSQVLYHLSYTPLFN